MGDTPFLIVGLGNPGNRYIGTRHNVGFYLVDELAKRCHVELHSTRWESLYQRTNCLGGKVCFIKPQTYMNLSGQAVSRFAGFYKIPSQRILVIHDDIDMGCGRLKIVSGGGAGGHNGIRSLIQHLGTKDFFRLKFGVGRPGHSGVSARMPVEKYVLAPFARNEQQLVEERVDHIELGVEKLVRGETAAAMNCVNSVR